MLISSDSETIPKTGPDTFFGHVDALDERSAEADGEMMGIAALHPSYQLTNVQNIVESPAVRGLRGSAEN